jgi:glycosyltransferase involved in cell wall biosynthesis
MTTRLMMVADAGAPTGFEKVMRHVATHLHNTGKYDLTVRGIGYYPEEKKTLKYPFLVKETEGTYGDPIGISNFQTWIEEDKPEVIWCVQDLWNILGFCLGKPLETPMVAYFPVDTPNMSFGNAWGLGAITEAVSYTKFGAHETAAGIRTAINVLAGNRPEFTEEPLEWIQSSRNGRTFNGRMDRYARYQNPNAFNVVPHGLDKGEYEPRDKAACRRALKLPASAFLITYVATNQFRKRQDLALRGFAKHVAKHPESRLILHCAHDNGLGWDLIQLAHLYGIRDKIILTHQTLGQLSDSDLCSLYNAADVNINTSGGEGWGLPIFESAACGVPQIVPNWSATRELWKDHGVLLDIADYRIEPRMGINTAHAVVDTDDLANALNALASTPQLCEQWGTAAKKHAEAQPSWDLVGGAFDQIITNALSEPAAREYSLKQLQSLQEGEVKCEISGWL